MARSSRSRLFFLLVFGLGGVAILVGLGTWQVQRLAWKEGLIAELEARLSADPVPLPAAPTEAGDEYMRVEVSGRYLPRELHVLTSVRPDGPGFRIIAPFETDTGRRILVDRGFVPQTDKEASRDRPETTVTGSLLWPQETDGFTPEPDREGNYWFARDLPLMAEALDTDPLLIVAESNPGLWPKAQPLTVNLPNDHLGYAITWYGLAIGWAVMTVFLIRAGRRP